MVLLIWLCPMGKNLIAKNKNYSDQVNLLSSGFLKEPELFSINVCFGLL
jgi:hypothetical protein